MDRRDTEALFSLADGIDTKLMKLGAICAAVTGLAQSLMALYFGKIVDTFGASSDPSNVVSDLTKVSVQLVCLAIGTAIVSFLQTFCWMVTGKRQAARIRGLYLKTVLKQDITFFDTETTREEVIRRMSRDTICIQDAIGEKVGKYIQLSLRFSCSLIIAFFRGWLLALVLLCCFLLLEVAGTVLSISFSKLTSREQFAYAEARNIVEQTIRAIRTVESFTGEKAAIKKYKRSVATAYDASVKQDLVLGFGIGAVLLCTYSSYGLAVWFGSKLIIEKGYNAGQVVTVMFAITFCKGYLEDASSWFLAIINGNAAAYEMIQGIKRKPQIDSYNTNGIVPQDIKGDIELNDVYFSYPARPDVLIFSGLSLFVPSGTTAALVGQSGSGKSTVISLIERFYDPQDGEVLIDGINLKNLQLKWIREKIGLVNSEPILFTTTIKENIAYGKENATDEEIRRAIILANAAKFIDKLPKGLDTMVGEHRTQMSGGQKMRIAIARAILKNPKILLLDEATSALDVESKRIVQDALIRIKSNRTIIVVAHDLNTIQNADTIVIFRQGKIIEQGSHVELTQDPEGAYSQLIRLQEGAKQAQDVQTNDADGVDLIYEDESVNRIRSQMLSWRRSTSRDSSIITECVTGGGGNIEKGGKDVETKRNVSIKRLSYMARPEYKYMAIGLFAAAVRGVIFPFLGLFLSTAIKIFYEPPHELRNASKFWASLFVLLGVIDLVFIQVEYYFLGVVSGKLIQRLQNLCFGKIVYQEISWFDDPAHSSDAINERLAVDATSMKSHADDYLALIVQTIAAVTTTLIIAFKANWSLALVVLILLPFLGFYGCVQMKFLKAERNEDLEASQVANDAVSSIQTVSSFCAEQRIMDLYEKKCEAPTTNGMWQGLAHGFSLFVLYFYYALYFYMGAQLVQQGKATFPEVLKVFFVFRMAAVKVLNSCALYPDIKKATDFAASIFEILDTKQKIN